MDNYTLTTTNSLGHTDVQKKLEKDYIMIKIKKILKSALSLFGMFLLLGVISSQAATLTVSTTADEGIGSLRQAIIDAALNAEANIVTFSIPTTDPGYNLAENRFTINLISPLPNIPLAPMTIDNNQPQAVTVKGNNTFRILTLVNNAVLIINNLTISNGFNGFQNAHKFTGDSTYGLGGGIYMGDSATLNLNGCVVKDNSSAFNGGGIYISNSATLNVSESMIQGNTAGNGGGIYINLSGTLNLSTSTISGNIANNGGNGGAIFNNTSGTINGASNTIDGNSADNYGGGIYNTATIILTNNTITANTATVGGGGIYNNFTATLDNNLVALNAAPDGNDLLGRGSLGNAYTGTYNLIANADGCEGLGSITNQSGSTEIPMLPSIGPLQNNGGKTLTRALITGSPAIDKGNSPVLIADQRGQARPYDNPLVFNTGNGADIGAYEIQYLAPTTTIVSVGGRILISDGRGESGVSGAFVYLTDLSGNIRIARTSSFGYYTFKDVRVSETYVINVQHKRYQFAPQVVEVLDVLTELNFFAL